MSHYIYFCSFFLYYSFCIAGVKQCLFRAAPEEAPRCMRKGSTYWSKTSFVFLQLKLFFYFIASVVKYIIPCHLKIFFLKDYGFVLVFKAL